MPSNKKILNFVLLLLCVAAVLVPLTLFAQAPIGTSSGFTDPLKGTSIPKALARLINFMLGLVGLLSIAALVYGGIMYIVSLGNDSRVGTAKKTITWAIVGLAISLLSVLLVQFVGKILGV